MRKVLVVLVLVLVSCSHGQSRAERCREYKDALVVAYADPTSHDPVTGLKDVDRKDVEDSRAAYQQGLQPGGEGPNLPNWDGYVKRQIPVALARQKC